MPSADPSSDNAARGHFETLPPSRLNDSHFLCEQRAGPSFEGDTSIVLSEELSELMTEMTAMTTTIESLRPSAATAAYSELEKASPAQMVLCMFEEWTDSQNVVMEPRSEDGRLLEAHGYKFFLRKFGEEHAFMILRESMRDVIEVESLIAYPDRRGHGTAMLFKLCELADRLDVQLWLDAVPYGANRSRIPLPKLKQVYRRFGFFPIRAPHLRWITEFHHWNHARMKNVMLRNPMEAIHPRQEDTSEWEITAR